MIGGAGALLRDVGGLELVVLLVVVALLVLFGPTKLPAFARAVGRAWGEFRRGRLEIEREIRDEFGEGKR